MGERTVMQEALLYEFSVDRHVPANHLLRAINRFVDLSGLRSQGSEEVDWEAMATTRRSAKEYLDTLDDATWGAASEVLRSTHEVARDIATTNSYVISCRKRKKVGMLSPSQAHPEV